MQPVDETIAFGPLRLTVNMQDRGGAAYAGAGWHEESRNPLYADIQALLRPGWVFDIGANYGLTALFARQRFPQARIVAVEPYGALVGYIRRNVAQNGIEDIDIVEAVVGDASAAEARFYIRPTASQDCRVRSPGPGWRPIITAQTTLDALAADVPDDAGVYIKIDTQGYEEHVFRGAAGFFARHRRWIVKTEFAPAWLRSQGSDPLALLEELTGRFAVAEAPARTGFGDGPLADALRRPLAASDLQRFLDHVVGLNRDGRGWVDLLVLPHALLAEIRAMADAAPSKAVPAPAAPPADAAALVARLDRMEGELAALRAQNLSLDVASVLLGARHLLVNDGGAPARLPPTLMRNAHGHLLLMMLVSEAAAKAPGRFAGKTLFEIGTTRERLPDQGSTEKLALFAALLGMRFVTIDMDPRNTERAQGVIGLLNPHSKAVTDRGERLLATHHGPFDVVYLDAFDCAHGRHSEARQRSYRDNLESEITDEACWQMHLACAPSLVARMPPGGIVVFDDSWADAEGAYRGKGKLAIPYLLERGFRLLQATAQAVALEKS